MSGYVITWDGVASSAVSPNVIMQKVSRGMVGGVRDVAVDIPGRDGAVLFQEARGNRQITVQATLVSADTAQRHADVTTLADWLDKSGYKKLLISDQPDRYWEAGLRADPNPDEWRLLSKFMLTFTAQPYAFALAVSSSTASGSNGGAQSFSISDSINAHPVMEITARGGDVVAPTITVNGNILQYSGTILQDQTVTISSLNYTVVAGSNTDLELTGVFTPGTVFPADVSGDFPVLIEGSNSWTVAWTGTATYVDVSFTWRRRYR